MLILRIDCLRSLSFRDMDQRQASVADAATNTCAWLLEHENYTRWLAQPCTLLWIVGKPGTGKSTLVSYALEKEKALQKASHSNDVIASFFFFGRGSDLQKNSCGLFRSLLYQLLGQIPDMLSDFIPIYEEKSRKLKSGSELEWTEKELRTFLENWILNDSSNRRIRIYVDALDEAGRDVATELVNYFKKLTEAPSPTGASLQICFSCRHYPVVVPKDALKISVEEENNQDIATYVHQNLKDHFSDADKAQLEREIVGKASSIFQWVILVIPIIIESQQDGANVRKIRQEIEKIPGELSDLYERILSSVKDQKQKRAVQLMQWVCFAERPLSLEELRFAMVVDITNEFTSLQDCQNSMDFAETDEQMRSIVRSHSGGLVETVRFADKHIVQFIHQSVKDYLIEGGLQKFDGPNSWFHDVNWYLEQNKQLKLPDSLSDDVVGLAHFRISRSCVKYVTLEEVLGGIQRFPPNDYSETQREAKTEIHRRFPFLRYATKWTSHAEIVEKQRIPQNDLLGLFRWPSDDIIESWALFLVASFSSDSLRQVRALLGAASQDGLLSVIEAMFERGGAENDSKESLGETPLSVAVQWGHKDVVRLLIEGGAEINWKDKWGTTPVYKAVRRGHEDMVRLLIERGAEINWGDLWGRTPLFVAVQLGYEDVVRLLIERGADVDLEDNSGLTPFRRQGHESMIQLLVEHGGAESSEEKL